MQVNQRIRLEDLRSLSPQEFESAAQICEKIKKILDKQKYIMTNTQKYLNNIDKSVKELFIKSKGLKGELIIDYLKKCELACKHKLAFTN